MVRGLILVVALVATAAQAQDVSKAAKGANHSALPASEQRATKLASQAPPEPRTSPPLRSTSAAGEGNSNKRVDCSVVETLLSGGTPAFRTYPPPAAREGTNGIWRQAPYVGAAARCGRLYILQIWSRSKDAWVIAQARVRGPNDEVLEVNSLRINNEDESDDWVINVIVAEAPTEMKLARLTLDLTGKDGRVARPQVGNLP